MPRQRRSALFSLVVHCCCCCCCSVLFSVVVGLRLAPIRSRALRMGPRKADDEANATEPPKGRASTLFMQRASSAFGASGASFARLGSARLGSTRQPGESSAAEPTDERCATAEPCSRGSSEPQTNYVAFDVGSLFELGALALKRAAWCRSRRAQPDSSSLGAASFGFSGLQWASMGSDARLEIETFEANSCSRSLVCSFAVWLFCCFAVWQFGCLALVATLVAALVAALVGALVGALAACCLRLPATRSRPADLADCLAAQLRSANWLFAVRCSLAVIGVERN